MIVKGRIKKGLVALFVSLTLICATFLPALVAEAATGSITIHKMAIQSDYELNYKNDGKAITDDSTIIGKDADGNDLTLGDLDTLDGISFKIQSVKYKGTGDDTDVSNFEVTGDYETTGVTAGGGILKFDILPEGIYLITELDSSAIVAKSAPFLVSVPMTDPTDTTVNMWDVHVYPKNQIEDGPDIDKSVTESGNQHDTASYYEEVTWIIETGIPAGIGSAKQYVIEDNLLSPILRFIESSVKLTYIKDSAVETLEKEEDYVVDYTDKREDGKYDASITDSFKISLTSNGMTKLAGADSDTVLTTTYKTDFPYDSMTESDWAIYLGEALKNSSNLTYENEFGYKWTPDSPNPEVHLGGVQIHKVKASDNANLAGAEFKIYTSEEDAINGTNALKSPDGSGDDWVATSDTNGYASFYGLAYGTIGQEYDDPDASTDYWIAEVKAPEGYNLLTSPLKVTVNATSYSVANAIVVKNSSGFTLPITGDVGTIGIIVFGLLLIGGGVFVFVRFSRKKNTMK